MGNNNRTVEYMQGRLIETEFLKDEYTTREEKLGSLLLMETISNNYEMYRSYLKLARPKIDTQNSRIVNLKIDDCHCYIYLKPISVDRNKTVDSNKLSKYSQRLKWNPRLKNDKIVQKQYKSFVFGTYFTGDKVLFVLFEKDKFIRYESNSDTSCWINMGWIENAAINGYFLSTFKNEKSKTKDFKNIVIFDESYLSTFLNFAVKERYDGTYLKEGMLEMLEEYFLSKPENYNYTTTAIKFPIENDILLYSDFLTNLLWEKSESKHTRSAAQNYVEYRSKQTNLSLLEIESENNTFKKKTGDIYVEVHHIIPFKYSKLYQEIDINSFHNLICLSANKHREFHYGENRVGIIKSIVNTRYEQLCKYVEPILSTVPTRDELTTFIDFLY